MKRRAAVGVIGGNIIEEKDVTSAYDVGKHIALSGADLVCGGLGGTMETASKGAYENGGNVIGILPGENKLDANPYVTTALPTGMGIGRNTLVVRASDVLIAFPGSFGTLSEIALALNMKKTVIHMPGSWDISQIGNTEISNFIKASDADQAVRLALENL